MVRFRRDWLSALDVFLVRLSGQRSATQQPIAADGPLRGPPLNLTAGGAREEFAGSARTRRTGLGEGDE
jgi:hypothetical protein